MSLNRSKVAVAPRRVGAEDAKSPRHECRGFFSPVNAKNPKTF